VGDVMAMTHTLVLVRHAKSDYPPGIVDHDRPLNARGSRDAPFIGSWIRDNVPWPEAGAPVAFVSTAYRAQSTWALARKGFDDRWRAVDMHDEPLVYEASSTTLGRLVAVLPEHLGTAILVGHNPGLSDLVRTLCVDDEARAHATERFPTSSIAVLQTSGPWAGAIEAGRPFTVVGFHIARASILPQ
jgi:phosphohistidine phosphatase